MAWRASNAIEIVERGYELAGDERAWLQGVTDALAPALGSWGVCAYRVRTDAIDGVLMDGALVFSRERHPWMAALSPELVGTTYQPRSTVVQQIVENAVSVSTASTLAKPSEMQTYHRIMGGLGINDAVSVHAHDGVGGAVVFAAPQRAAVTVPARSAALLRKVALHVAAGLRLRHRLARAQEPSAVLDPAGRLLHATGPLESALLRGWLSAAVKHRERARGPLRKADAAAAMSLWRGLFAGSWSLVDRWERDGRRYVAAIENAPGAEDPRQLAPLERKVVRYAARGMSNADLAYALGLRASTVTSTLSRAMRKLGVTRRAGLLALVGAPQRSAAVELQGERLVVAELGATALSRERLRQLTGAQQHIARAIAQGHTDREIAQFLALSPRTVTTQVSRMLARLGLGSRHALTRHLWART